MCFAAAASALGITAAARADMTWNINGGTSWRTASNWSLNRVPNASDALLFPAPAGSDPEFLYAGTPDASLYARSLTFNGDYTFGLPTTSSTTPGLTIGSSTEAGVISVPTGKTVTFVSTRLGVQKGLVKTSGGTLQLDRFDVLRGPIAASGGTLNLGQGYDLVDTLDRYGDSTNTISATQARIVLASSNASAPTQHAFDLSEGVLDVTGSLTMAKPLGGSGYWQLGGRGALTLTATSTRLGDTLIGDGNTIGPAQLYLSANTQLGSVTNNITLDSGELLTTASITMSRNITVNGTSSIPGGYLSPAVNTTLTLNGDLRGIGVLHKRGLGVVVVNHSTPSLTKSVEVIEGTLRLGEASSFNGVTNPLILNGGTLESTVTRSLTCPVDVRNATSALSVTGSSVLSLSELYGDNPITKTGSGTLAISGTTFNRYNDGIHVDDGTLLINESATKFGRGDVYLTHGTLAFAPGVVVSTTFLLHGSAGLTTTISLGAGASVRFGPALDTDVATLNVIGTGTLFLSQPSLRTGSSSIAGIVQLGGGSGLGTGTATVTSGGVLELANNITATAPLALQYGATLRAAGSATYGGAIGITGAVPIFATTAATDRLTIGDAANDLSGPATATIRTLGPGTVVLPFNNANYQGGWTVEAGTLRVDAATALGTGVNTVDVGAATLELGPGITLNRQIALGKAATIRAAGTGTSVTPLITVLDGAVVRVGTVGAADNFSARFDGGYGSTTSVSGPGQITLGTGSLYHGSWVFNGGTTLAAADSSFGNTPTPLTLGGGTLKATATLNSSTRSLAIPGNDGTFDSGTFTARFGNVDGEGKLIKVSAGKLIVDHLRTGGLTVGGGSVVIAQGNANAGTSRISDLALTGALDLGDSKLIVPYGVVGSPTGGVYNGLSGEIQKGRNGGAWYATVGLTTSVNSAALGYTSLGIATAGQLGLSSFGGLAVVPSDVLVAYTVSADSNLNGKTDFDDLIALAQNYNSPLAVSWAQGDFNYDGAVSFDDLLILAQNYGRSFVGGIVTADAALAASFDTDWAFAQTLVPEPTTLLAVALLTPPATRRRRAARRTPSHVA